jgi:hypothetical protein
MLLFLVAELAKNPPYMGLGNVVVKRLQGELGYVEVTQNTDPESQRKNKPTLIQSPYTGRVVYVVTAYKHPVTIMYWSGMERKFILTPAITNPTAENLIINASPRHNVVIEAEGKGLVQMAYVILSEDQCSSGVELVTNRTFTWSVWQQRIEASFEKCLLFSPASRYLRYNVRLSQMDNRFDCVTIHQTRVGSRWYDRYETMENPSGWSSGSDVPWFFKFTVKRENGIVGKDVSLEIDMTSDTMEFRDMIETSILGVKAPKIDPGDEGKVIFRAEWVIPVVGCIAPSLLLVSWIFAFRNLYSKPVVRLDEDE